jgi:hypothetical protein
VESLLEITRLLVTKMPTSFFYLISLIVLLINCCKITAQISITTPRPQNTLEAQFPRATQSALAARETQSGASGSFILTVQPTGLVTTNSACSLVSYYLSSCNSASPGFSTLDYVYQIPCLCYSSITIWLPGLFDSAVSSCAQYVSTAELSEYTQLTSLVGFCPSSQPSTTSIKTTSFSTSTIATSSETFQNTVILVPTPSSPGLPGIQSMRSLN